MTAASNDTMFSLLMKGLAGLCDELRQLRDDLHNHAVITNGGAFTTVVPLSGSRLFSTAEMVPGAGAITQEAYENKNDGAVAVIVQAEPVVTTAPPAGFSYSNAAVLLTTRDNTTANQAHRIHVGTDPVTLILQSGATLYVAVMAEAAVTVKWSVVPLRGRMLLRGYK